MPMLMKKIMLGAVVFFIVFSCGAGDGNREDIKDTTKENYVSTTDATEDTLEITLSAVGDIMMGSDFPSPILPPSSGKHLFDNVKDSLVADIVFGNLEGPFAVGGYTSKNIKSGRTYAFRCPPGYASNLADAGFNCISLANNHIRDFGSNGIKTTVRTLDSLHIAHSGSIGDIVRLNIKGLRVGLIAFSTYSSTYNILDEDRSFRTIKSYSDSFDILIISMHAGSEGEGALHTKDVFEHLYGEPRGNVVKFAHKAIDNGADLILGSGPHVPRALELYKGKLVAYSLGNFCVYGRFGLDGATGKSLILKISLSEDGTFLKGRIVPLTIKRPGIPFIDVNKYAVNLIRNLSEKDFPSSAPEINDKGYITVKKMEEIEDAGGE